MVLATVLFICFASFTTADRFRVEDVRDEHLQFLNASKSLFTQLFTTREYQKELSPVYTKKSILSINGTEGLFPKFNVNVTLAYARIRRIIEAEKLLTIVVQFILSWVDLRLSWEPHKYDGIDEIFVNRNHVWMPENSLYDAESVTDVLPEYITPVKIRHDGSVTHDHVFYTQVVCDINVATFPFDSQVCPINFLSYSYNHTLVDMTGSIREFDYEYLTSNGEWLVQNITTSKNFVGLPGFMFDNLDFSFHIKRNPHWYIYVIALPCFILTCLSIIGMFWTPNVKEEQIGKLSIGLTSLMSMTVLLDMVSQQIPKTVTFPLLGIYVIVCIAIIGVGCVVLVMFTTKIEPEKERIEWTTLEKLRWQICSVHFALLLIFETLTITNDNKKKISLKRAFSQTEIFCSR